MLDTQAMTIRARSVVTDAIGFAQKRGDAVVRPEHLLKVLLDLGPETLVNQAFTFYNGLTADALEDAMALWELEATSPMHPAGDVFAGQPILHPQFEHALDLAQQEARDFTFAREGKIDVEHLLVALTLDPNTAVSHFLNQHGVYFVDLRIILRKLREGAIEPARAA